ncbi:hypothetical protein [Actinomadura madurae]|uniref:hypothetical protein n=1 Tax=Actinomadura madurae TaxID=1993 RepID=UPI0020D205FA|nr:hypothetical protein [Actinomadura madurae]MCQ0012896.1 hypothetical protein [Actinomadura madurae]
MSAPSAAASRAASCSFGVSSRVPGTGGSPRGCGSHTMGTPPGSSSSRDRTARCRATPRP